MKPTRQPGAGAFEDVSREQSVFINCPYDAQFVRLFDAIAFAIVACGFTPRSALESVPGPLTRMDRIVRCVDTSKYSIHDLSRCRGEGEENLGRFNMPFELGIAFAKGYPPHDRKVNHDWLVLGPRGHLLKKCISDLDGWDHGQHDETFESIIGQVILWLATRGDVQVPPPIEVNKANKTFQAELKKLRAKWQPQGPPWSDVIALARTVAKRAGFLSKREKLGKRQNRNPR